MKSGINNLRADLNELKNKSMLIKQACNFMGLCQEQAGGYYFRPGKDLNGRNIQGLRLEVSMNLDIIEDAISITILTRKWKSKAERHSDTQFVQGEGYIGIESTQYVPSTGDTRICTVYARLVTK